MTTVYFVRHAESDASFRDQRTRPLTEKGLVDRKLVTEFLRDKNVDAIISSPYKRAIDTLSDFANNNGFEIELVEDFRERDGDSGLAWGKGDIMSDTKLSDVKRQWSDFSYTYSDGECYAKVQTRNIAALNDILIRYRNKTIVVGTHGISLSTIINYYDSTYGFDDFMEMVYITPWVVRMYFKETGYLEMEKINLFSQPTK